MVRFKLLDIFLNGVWSQVWPDEGNTHGLVFRSAMDLPVIDLPPWIIPELKLELGPSVVLPPFLDQFD
jgi:hypothetical protein